MLKSFHNILEDTANIAQRRLDNGDIMQIAKIYALDAMFDTPKDVPEAVRKHKGYVNASNYSIEEVVEQVKKDYGRVDMLVHSLANGPEVKKPLLETSRKGYLAASSASAYSLVSMVARFGPLMPRHGSVVSLTYMAADRVVPGYGGGMSSAKAALESDTRTLAWEAGRRFGIRVNTISSGPIKSRAASAIGHDGEKAFIERMQDYSLHNAPLPEVLSTEHVGKAALCLLTELMGGVTGMTLYADMGLHTMGQAIDSPAFAPAAPKNAPKSKL